MLKVTDLAKSYGNLTLFTNLNFEIKRGEKVAIIGNNGTGKTTILKIINGQVKADQGEIKLGSKVHVGYYDQEHQVLDPDKTLFDELQDTYPNLDIHHNATFLGSIFYLLKMTYSSASKTSAVVNVQGISGKAYAIRGKSIDPRTSRLIIWI